MNTDNQLEEKSSGVPVNVGTFLKRVLSVVKDALKQKQDVVTGTPGQVVGFDANGNMEAQDFQGGGPVTSGVSSFNGRTGAVKPQEGDYTAEMVGADPAGSAQEVADTLRTEVEGNFTEQDEKLTTGLREVNNRVDTVEQDLDDKISSTGGTMQAALRFSQGPVARSSGESGSVSMQDDALTITSGTGIVKFVDEADGKNAVLSGVDFAVKSNEAVPLQQMEEALVNIPVPMTAEELRKILMNGGE